jgi:hypothetical protein|uniref:hypothetical protein n=1 Tax=Polynucleobacter sp. TaxID=2029855 RepID=UPI004047DEF8
MHIKITKSLLLHTQTPGLSNSLEALFPAGEYPALFTPEGMIEVMGQQKLRAIFSFSQFREKVSRGEFIVLDA